MPVPYHVKLTDGTTTYELPVLQDPETRELAWQEQELPFLIPRQGQGDASYINRDPETERVEEYRTWNMGFGSRYQEPGTYQKADGVDARFKSVLAPAPKLNDAWYIVQNGGAENTDAAYNPWTVLTVGDAMARSTTDKSTGVASWELSTTQGAVGANAYMTIANPTVWQGQAITFRGFIRFSGSGSGIRLYIQDSVATSNGALTTSASFIESSVARTIDAAATFVRFGVETPTGATGIRGYVDDCYIIIGNSTTYSACEFKAGLYIAVGQTVCKYNASELTFEAVLIVSNNCTSLASHGGVLYVAIDGAVYQYSTNGTTWTASTRGGDADDADYFVSVGGSAARTLWKALKPNTLSSSDNGTNGSTAWTDYTVGTSDRNITGLFPYQNAPIVGREDGLWVWDDVCRDFSDITPEFRSNPSTVNFATGIAFNGWLYLSTDQQGFFRYRFDGSGHIIEELSKGFAPAGLDTYGGRIKALAEGGRWLYSIQDNPSTTSSATNAAHILTFEEDREGRHIHSLHDIGATDIYFATVFSNTLFVFGDLFPASGSLNVPTYYGMALPTTVQTPFLETSPSLETTGTIDFAVWDGGFLSETKALLSWEFFGENIDANNYWSISYKRAGESSFTSIGNFNSLSSGSQTLKAKTLIAAAANRSSKTWQWRMTYTYDGSGVAPLCTGLVVKALLRPANTQRQFVFSLDLESPALIMPDGTFQHITPRTVYEQMRTWEDTAWPLTLTISDATTAYDVILRPVQLRMMTTSADGAGERLVVDVVAKEVNT